MVARLIEFLWDKALYGRVTTPLFDFFRKGSGHETTQTTERSHMFKRGRGKLFLSVEVQYLHTILL